MRFGIRFPGSGPFARADTIIRIGKEAEALGYDSIWTHDHLFLDPKDVPHHLQAGSIEAVKNSQKPIVYEPLTTLAFIAGATTRIRLGTSILVLPLRNPIWLAKQTATLDALSKGRLILGIGLGRYEKEFKILGVPFKEKAAITEESIRILRNIWIQPTSNFDGGYHKISGIRFYPKPHQRPCPPIWIGGRSKHAIRRVVEMGDGWLQGFKTPNELEKAMFQLKIYAKESRRDISEIVVSSEHMLAIAKSRDKAIKRSSLTLRIKFGSVKNGVEKNLIGTPRDISEKLEQYVRIGITHFLLRIISLDVKEMLQEMKIFSKEVLTSFT